MNTIREISFEGEWKIIQPEVNMGSLHIEKTGETYRCSWLYQNDSTQSYLGIGILQDNILLVSRFVEDKGNDALPRGGIGVYKQIGDKRSNSALWAATQNFTVLGSGIAFRKETIDGFEGSYEVKYFLKGHESAFNLNIMPKEKSNLYSLTWAIGEKQVLRGIGYLLDGQMALAWGDLTTDCELIILSFAMKDDQYSLISKNVILRNFSIYEEILGNDY